MRCCNPGAGPFGLGGSGSDMLRGRSSVKIYDIPGPNLEGLQVKIEKLAKRAIKLGGEPITLEIVGQREVEIKKGVPLTLYAVKVCGTAPWMKGWRFVAKLEHRQGDSETGYLNVVKTLPRETCPTKYRTVAPWCDHCEKVRDRHNTYVVSDVQGRCQQVGSTCLKDFTGHADPQALASIAETLFAAIASCDDAEYKPLECGGYSPYQIYTDHFLAAVVSNIRRFGWIPKARATMFSCSTAEAVITELFRHNPSQQELLEQAPIATDIKLANEALAWARTELTPEKVKTESDYLWSLGLIVAEDILLIKDAGFAASLIPCYQRAIQKELDRQSKPEGAFVGEVGKKVSLEGNLVFTKAISGNYGVTTLHKWIDDAGNVFIWFASRTSLPLGYRYRVEGKVKRHSEFNGEKQTVLTRCLTEYVPVETDGDSVYAIDEIKLAQVVALVKADGRKTNARKVRAEILGPWHDEGGEHAQFLEEADAETLAAWFVRIC